MSVNERIVWIDVESTGLNVFRDFMLEIAAVVTDMHGNVVGEPFSALVSHSNVSTLVDMADDNVVAMHERSGLWEDLWNSRDCSTLPDIADNMVAWLDDVIPDANSTVLYFGGNSPKLDRDFVRMCLPGVSTRFSHRSIDMTSISLAVSRNSGAPHIQRQNKHRALDDVVDSIREFQSFVGQLKKWDDNNGNCLH